MCPVLYNFWTHDSISTDPMLFCTGPKPFPVEKYYSCPSFHPQSQTKLDIFFEHPGKKKKGTQLFYFTQLVFTNPPMRSLLNYIYIYIYSVKKWKWKCIMHLVLLVVFGLKNIFWFFLKTSLCLLDSSGRVQKMSPGPIVGPRSKQSVLAYYGRTSQLEN